MTVQSYYIACPTYDGRICGSTSQALWNTASEKMTCINMHESTALNLCCNTLLCNALNFRDLNGLDLFAMLHADVTPEPFWADKAAELLYRHDADMLSVVMAIKDESRGTSTAISDPLDELNPTRLTLDEVHSLPETFSLTDILEPADAVGRELLVNTGCFVMRLDRPWLDTDKVFFRTIDGIVKENGKHKPRVLSEDWFFTRAAARNGAKVMATRAIRATHHGKKDYPNWID